jgi:hypothetical protein
MASGSREGGGGGRRLYWMEAEETTTARRGAMSKGDVTAPWGGLRETLKALSLMSDERNV